MAIELEIQESDERAIIFVAKNVGRKASDSYAVGSDYAV
jgi:hypothetical protein